MQKGILIGVEGLGILNFDIPPSSFEISCANKNPLKRIRRLRPLKGNKS